MGQSPGDDIKITEIFFVRLSIKVGRCQKFELSHAHQIVLLSICERTLGATLWEVPIYYKCLLGR